jgi:hypothetical protein
MEILVVGIFPMVQQPPVGQGLIIIKASRSHSHTWRSVGLLWTSDQPDAETSTLQHTTLHKRKTAMLPAEFGHAIPGSEMSQTHALDRTSIGTGCGYYLYLSYSKMESIILFYLKCIPYKLKNLYTQVKL